MRRRLRARLLLATISAATSVLAVGGAQSASASVQSGRTAPASSPATAKPTKVKAGSTWTLERSGTGCQNDAFGKRSRFHATASDGSGDSGSYKGSKHLTMTWKAGLDAGAVFSGQWKKADDDYSGHYSLGGQTADATLSPYVSGACLSGSSLTARPTSPVIVLGQGDTDSATVYGSGDVTPTGTVAFYVCTGKSSACTVAGASSTLPSVAVTGSDGVATATSAAETPASPGYYCFLAVYSGDTTYATSSDGSVADQCFDVTSGGAATATSRSKGRGTRSAKASRITPGSTWTLERSGANCEAETFATGHRFSAAVVNGSGNTGSYRGRNTLVMKWTTGSASGEVYQARWRRAAGDYTGSVTEDGSSINASLVPVATNPCADLEAQPESPSVSTGGSESDTARMTGLGGPTPNGSVHFYLCPGDAGPCSTGSSGVVDLGSTDLTVSGSSASADSAFDDSLAAGSYCYLAVYSGNSHYPGVSADSTGDQCFSVTAPAAPTAPGFSGTPALHDVTLGQSDSDTATVTGSDEISPSGTVTFYLCGPDPRVPCTIAAGNDNEVGSPVTVSDADSTSPDVVSATSAPVTPTAEGDYCFLAVYSGDADYAAASDATMTHECFSVSFPAAAATDGNR